MPTRNNDIGWSLPPEGLWGFAHCAGPESWYVWSGIPYEQKLNRLIGDLKTLGANSFRPHIHWHRVESVIGGDIAGPLEVTGDMVDAYANGDGVDWSIYDAMIDVLVDGGIEPHIVLGAGYDFELPLTGRSGLFVRATPSVIGHDVYLGHCYLHARAAVRRYAGRVHVWQLENELNVAGETMMFMGWRTGKAWLDPGFNYALIETLCQAVKEEDPGALTSHNFHTDLKLIPAVYDWRDDLISWLPFLDIVGIDAYPNYLAGRPQRGPAVGKRVRRALELSGGRPVMVLESGYPVKPRYRLMSEAGQALYARDAIESSAREGASGYYYYKLCSPEGRKIEGPWSDRGLESVEPWWGMIRADDTNRPSFSQFKGAVEKAKQLRRQGTGK